MRQATDLEYYFENVTKAGHAISAIAPFRIVVHPYIGRLGGDVRLHVLVALGPAILLMALHYWWVMRADRLIRGSVGGSVEKNAAERVAVDPREPRSMGEQT